MKPKYWLSGGSHSLLGNGPGKRSDAGGAGGQDAPADIYHRQGVGNCGPVRGARTPSRDQRGEVASLENILSDEKLTHTTRQVSEVETTDTADSEQASLQSLAQTTADQDVGKTTAQSLGVAWAAHQRRVAELLPVGHGPGIFQLAACVWKLSVLRRLQRTEDAYEHVFDNSEETNGRFGVYQWLDKVYQAQVFNYGSRLLYDIIIPKPAALFREALARPRSQAALPPRPAKFTTPPDKLHLYNWSYYAAGHQATGVEAPPHAEIVVSESFGGRAQDPFSSQSEPTHWRSGSSHHVYT